MNTPQRNVVLRVLLYEGSEAWITNTMAHNAVKPGVWGKLSLNEHFSIQEVTLPGWLSWILAKLASRQPMAKVGSFVGKGQYGQGQ